jgi:hypothetical protein
MSEYGDKMLDRIARAYDEATRGTDAPAWDALARPSQALEQE